MDVPFVIFVILHVAVTSKPVAERVIANQRLTLPCSIKMTIRSGMLQWRFRPRGTSSYKLLCVKKPEEDNCVKNNNQEEWLKNININLDNIEIDKVTSVHSGTYQCNYMDSSDLEKFIIDVNVLTPPGKPKIRMNSTYFTEDKMVTLTCQSDGGNPKPSLKWIWKDFSNKAVLKRNMKNESLTHPESTYGSTVQISSWTPKSFDDSNSLRCIAENNLASVQSDWVFLNVNYPPIIYDFPLSPYFALLGSDINLECKATQKTVANFTWKSSEGLELSHSAHLILNSISIFQKGSYHCHVSNTFGTSSATVNITVLSSPIIELEQSLTVVEGEKFRSTCNVIPSFSNVSWWIGSRCVSSTRSLEVVLPGVKPVAVDCRASVLLNNHPERPFLSSSQQTVTVTIQYKPRRPSIAIHPLGSLVVGMDVTITCIPNLLEPGFPKSDYSWARSNSRWTKNNTNFLSFSSLTFNDSDTYVCNLFNIIGQSEEMKFKLVINGQPQLNIPDNQAPSLVKIRERQLVSVSCHFQAYPPPEITWLNNDLLVFHSDNTSGHRLELKQTAVNTFVSRLQVQLPFQTSHDVFRCQATNDYGMCFHDFNIQVQYPPRIVSDLFIVAADSTGHTTSREAAHLNCTVSGLPLATVAWSRKLLNKEENSIVNSTRYLIRETQRNDAVENVLYVRHFLAEDYGRYFCVATNSEGQLETQFDLRRLSVPDASHDLILYKQSWNSLSFKWIPGFNGGYPQTFIVSYITDMQKSPNQMKIYQPNANLLHLLPDTFYTVTISSSNTLGTTPSTLSVKVKTEVVRLLEEKVLSINKSEQMLELRLPLNLSTSIFCLKVEEMERNGNLPAPWKELLKCSKDVYSRVSIDNLMGRFRVRICLINDTDVCSNPIADSVTLEAASSMLTTKLIGTVALVCTILVIMLAILLSFILVRARKLLPGMSSLKDVKLMHNSSRDDLLKYIAKPLSTMHSNHDEMQGDFGGCPLLGTYSCEPFQLSNAPMEIFNVCPTNNIFNEGLYSTLIKSNSLNVFSTDASSPQTLNHSTFVNSSPCYYHNDQPMSAVPLPANNTIKVKKIFLEVMV